MSQPVQVDDGHRQRLAYIYVRQSTLRQVAEHTESQDLQYQLVARARSLGWAERQIVVIDEDLGKSAISSSDRTGFQRLFTDVGTGKVGILLVTDVSRLARNCADWYQLLDLAAYNDVLVGDSGGLYNPRAYDDRLLLGVKGAFSEAQWYIMRQQMQAARLNKAKRGELALRLPIGYERLPEGEVVLAADRQVQDAVRLVFRLFAQTGSARATLRRLQERGIQLPRQQRTALGGLTIVWGPARYQQVYQMLKLPAYAGVYAYGQRQRESLPGKQGVRYGGRLPPEAWLVRLPDSYPAYISWEEYLSNQETLAENWQATPFAAAGEGAGHGGRAGSGRALLQGVVYCGHCGRPLRVRYREKPAYVCDAGKMARDEPRCNYLPHAHVDQAVVAAFLEAVQPAALEVALAAVEELAGQRAALQQQWQQQLERARYQVALARARYEQVDPHLRLVAAVLEAAWEEALQAEQQLLQEWEEVQAAALQPLSAAEEELVRRLAHDLPALWGAETTTIPDRKRLLRTLIASVTLDRRQEEGVTHIQICWHTGAITRLAAARPHPGHPSDAALLERVRALAAAGHGDEQIAALLNAEGVVSSWHVREDAAYVPGRPVSYWTTERVRHLRYKHKIAADPAAAGLVPAQVAAAELGVSFGTLLDWFRRGLLPGRQRQPHAPAWIRLDEAVKERLSGRAPRSLAGDPQLIPLGEAAGHFGLTPLAMTAALKAGRLVAWRLEYGCHYRWYVQETDPDSAESANLLPK